MTESDEVGVLAVIDYAYDNLDRLTSEKRTLQNPYRASILLFGRSELLNPSRKKFVWRRGVLDCGLTVGILWSATMAWFNTDRVEFWIGFFVHLLLLPFWLLGGYVWGVVMWKWMKKRERPSTTILPADSEGRD